MEGYDTVQGAHSPPISPLGSIQPCTLYRKGHISPFSPKCIMPLSSELSRLSLFQISFNQDTSIFVLKREFYILIVFLYFSGNLFFSVLKYVSVLGGDCSFVLSSYKGTKAERIPVVSVLGFAELKIWGNAHST